MAYPRRLARIVHRIGEVAHQHDVEAEARQLPDPERAAQHAHIGMYSHQSRVADALLLEEAEHLFAGIGDSVGLGNRKSWMLPAEAAHSIAHDIVIAWLGGIVEGKRRFDGPVQVTPFCQRE